MALNSRKKDIKLTAGAVLDLINGGKVDKPVLQILGIKKIVGPNNDNERYRLNVSDGVNASSFAMLATQLGYYVEDGNLDKYAVISVENYICNLVQKDKRIFILLDIVILASGSEIGRALGEPLQVGVQANAEGNSASNSNDSRNLNSNVSALKRNASPKKPPGFYNQNTAKYGVNTSSTSTKIVMPIANITPYQNKWTIRARVANKSPIRTWSNSRGEGKLFSMDLIDESGEIRATAFKDQCDKFYDMIEVNKVYYISRGSLKSANKNFTSIKNDYEMSFNTETIVEPCTDYADDIPTLKFNFVPIADIAKIEKDAMIDVIGVVKKASEVQTIISRSTSKEFKKRDLHIVDNSGMEVTLTIWADEAERFDSSDNPVVAVKGVKVSDFGGKSLSTMSSTTFSINPKLKETDALRLWYSKEGSSRETESISKTGSGGFATNWKLLWDLKGDNFQNMDKADYCTVRGVITFMKSENSMYQACPMPECNKKVIDLNTGLYRCEKCNKEFDSFKWRLLLSVSISDFSDNIWVTCFQETAEAILGLVSEELGNLKENDETEYIKVFQRATFKEFIFKLRSKMETFNDETRIRITAVSVTPINFIEYNKKLIEDIKSLM